MSEGPSEALVALLERLGLATAQQIHAVRGKARALARQLPLFSSVWVDALVAARHLTPFQAQQIHAGRGETLKLGPYVLTEPRGSLGYAEVFRAREIATRRQVLLVRGVETCRQPAEVQRRVEELVCRVQRIENEGYARIGDAGVEHHTPWAVCPQVPAISAAQWLWRKGRFPPELVLEIARQTVARLRELASVGVVHGDLALAGILLAGGDVHLPWGGVRGIWRPHESYSEAHLPPEAFRYLAPERIADGTEPDQRSDLYSLGCVWWHMLAGRPAVSGGDGLTQMQAAHAARIRDIRFFAPDAPAPLAAAVSACTQTESNRRPESLDRLSAMLGPSTRGGRQALARSLHVRAKNTARLIDWTVHLGQSKQTPVWMAAAAGCLVVVAALALPGWMAAKSPSHTAAAAASSNEPGEDGTVTTSTDSTGSAAEPLSARKPPWAASTETGASAATATPPAQPSPEKDGGAADLVLPAGRPVAAESLRLTAGQIVRPQGGTRGQVMVPASGLKIAVDDVRFEHIEFVAAVAAPAAERSTLIDLRAHRLELDSCIFRGQAQQPTTAIDWSRPQQPEGRLLPVAGRIQMVDCVMSEVQLGIDCQAERPVTIEMENVLLSTAQPGSRLFRLSRHPGVENPVKLRLAACTLRGGDALLEIEHDAPEPAAGKVSLQATHCVFAPHRAGALVRWVGDADPRSVLAELACHGKGSLLSPAASLLVWRDGLGRRHLLDDAGVQVDGLVRASFEFVGGDAHHAAAAQVARWSAPLRSDQPPGIRAAALPSSATAK